MRKAENFRGQRFGRLTVIDRAKDYISPKGCHRPMWLCRCDCGNEIVTDTTKLKSKHTQSCGCLKNGKTSERFKKHGKSRTKAHNEWVGIKQRCLNTRCFDYKDYGGRGITVCDRWRDSFVSFYEDVSKLPHFGENGYSLDRIDTNGNYEPNNVRWASLQTQNNNKRNNRLLTYDGRTQTVAQWAREMNIPYSRLISRIYIGWSVEKALTTK